MDCYQVELTRSATKDLRAIDRQSIPRIIAAIDALAHDPTPLGSKKLAGSEHTFRIRVGDYRIVYDMHDAQLIILVIRVRHRKDAYR